MSDYVITDTFARHEIKSEVRADGLTSWVLARPREDVDGWCWAFWCRVTVSDGSIVVIGDFDPTVFAGSSSDACPKSIVAWMGGRELCDYVMQKARAGTGRDAAMTLNVEAAREDLQELINEREKSIAEFDGAEGYFDEIESLRHDIAAFREGLDAPCEGYDYPYSAGDVLAMMEAVGEYTYSVRAPENDYFDRLTRTTIECTKHVRHTIEAEEYHSIGERPAKRVVIAHLALQRLYALLTQREQSKVA